MFFFNIYVMPCAHALAMHCAVAKKLFMRIMAQPRSAAKACDIHFFFNTHAMPDALTIATRRAVSNSLFACDRTFVCCNPNCIHLHHVSL